MPLDIVRLKRVDGDRLEILVQLAKSATLEIRVRGEANAEVGDPTVQINFPCGERADAGPFPCWQSRGIYRQSDGLLPDRPMEIEVRAFRFKTLITQPFRFTAEGQKGVVELTLERDVGKKDAEGPGRVPVTFNTPEGQPIVQQAKPR